MTRFDKSDNHKVSPEKEKVVKHKSKTELVDISNIKQIIKDFIKDASGNMDPGDIIKIIETKSNRPTIIISDRPALFNVSKISNGFDFETIMEDEIPQGYRKVSYEEVNKKIEDKYYDDSDRYSSAMDILASYVRGSENNTHGSYG